jgi:hypothetical protein
MTLLLLRVPGMATTLVFVSALPSTCALSGSYQYPSRGVLTSESFCLFRRRFPSRIFEPQSESESDCDRAAAAVAGELTRDRRRRSDCRLRDRARTRSLTQARGLAPGRRRVRPGPQAALSRRRVTVPGAPGAAQAPAGVSGVPVAQ